VLVRARLATIGRHYEEAAQDLGASPLGSLRRVILPMLAPAIFASTVLVFADVIDDFVIVRYLSGDASTEPASVKIYNTARAAPTPALNALATILLLTALVVVAAGYGIYRLLSRGDETHTDRTVGAFAGEV
jgi:spermidine/putrescine transport system permease protein